MDKVEILISQLTNKTRVVSKLIKEEHHIFENLWKLASIKSYNVLNEFKQKDYIRLCSICLSKSNHMSPQ